jgi:hypothetical protein
MVRNQKFGTSQFEASSAKPHSVRAHTHRDTNTRVRASSELQAAGYTSNVFEVRECTIDSPVAMQAIKVLPQLDQHAFPSSEKSEKSAYSLWLIEFMLAG